MFAQLDAKRMVHAVEPLLRHLTAIEALRDAGLTNLKVHHGALGSVERRVLYSAPKAGRLHGRVEMLEDVDQARSANSDQENKTTSFPVYRLDHLFATVRAPEKLAFAHIECALT